MLHMPEEVKCPRCDEVMASLQACHLICKNCGAIWIVLTKAVVIRNLVCLGYNLQTYSMVHIWIVLTKAVIGN